MASAFPLVYSFEGITPVIDPSAYVHPTAMLIGDVIVGPGCYVAAGAVMRADFGRIELRREANLQDNCVVHSIPNFDCVMDERSQVGHGAVLHGCRIGRGTLVGMNAVVLDRAVVGDAAIVAAMALVRAGSEIPPRVLAAGVPAKVVRPLSDEQVRGIDDGCQQYVELAQRCRAGLVAVPALQAPEPGRARPDWSKWGF